MRIMLEEKCHDFSAFITLTYDDDHRPVGHSLDKVHLQKFLKRLRRRIPYKIRYFAVGEYGAISGREHYHVLVFGLPICDHHLVQESWPYGFVQVGPLQSGGASYVAGYCTKKYTSVEDVPLGKIPEFSTMSRSPGIGVPYLTNLINNLLRDRLQFVGDDYKYIRISGMLLPVDNFLQEKINKIIGYEKLERPLWEDIMIDAKTYKNRLYPEALNDKIAISRRKALQKIRLQKAYRKM